MRLNHFTRSPAAIHILNVTELEGNSGRLIVDSNHTKSQSPRKCSPPVLFLRKTQRGKVTVLGIQRRSRVAQSNSSAISLVVMDQRGLSAYLPSQITISSQCLHNLFSTFLLGKTW